MFCSHFDDDKYSGDNFVPLSKDSTYAFGSGQLGQLKVP